MQNQFTFMISCSQQQVQLGRSYKWALVSNVYGMQVAKLLTYGCNLIFGVEFESIIQSDSWRVQTRVRALHKLNIATGLLWHILLPLTHIPCIEREPIFTVFVRLAAGSGLAWLGATTEAQDESNSRFDGGAFFPHSRPKYTAHSLFYNDTPPLISSRILALRSLLNASQWLIYDITSQLFGIALWIYQRK